MTDHALAALGDGSRSPQPPTHIVDLAVEVSGWSPCQSKRGVVVFRDENVLGHGYNYKPRGFDCDGSDTCKATCRTEAIHAEQQALLSLGRAADGAQMLHVKSVNGALVPSGGPSCVQCSKLALVCGIKAVWLYHADGWQRYEMQEFHRLSLVGAAVPRAPRPTQNAQGLTSGCPDGHGLMTYHPDDGTPGGEWWECPVCRLQCMLPDPPARAPRAPLEPLVRELDRLAAWLEDPNEACADRGNPHRVAATLRGIVRTHVPRCPKCDGMAQAPSAYCVACERAIVGSAELAAARSALPPPQPEEDDALHTGDDERIDLVSSIIAAAEELDGDDDVTEIAAGIIDDCHKLDALLVETIKQERAALPRVPEPDLIALADWLDRFREALERNQRSADLYMQEMSGLENWSTGLRATVARVPKSEQEALIRRWRANGAAYDTVHATMGIGWTACAEELESALRAVRAARVPEPDLEPANDE